MKKKPLKTSQPPRPFRTKPFKEYTPNEKAIWYVKYTALFSMLLIPIIILVSPGYWINFISSPKFYFSSVVFFLIPFLIILFKPFWRNPFFLLPFSASFIISSQTIRYENFLMNYWFLLACILILFSLYRTKPPYRAIERRLYLTSYFTHYFEVRSFWRITILVILPVFIPFLFIFLNLYQPI